MLVLSRRLDESITIDGDIVVTVCRINDESVRLGIEAPRHKIIVRNEINEDADSTSAIDGPNV